MRKMISVCMTVFFVTITIIGCFPKPQDKYDKGYSSNNEPNGNEERDVSEFPIYIDDRDLEKLTFNAEVKMPTSFNINQKLSIASAEPRSWNRENIVSEISNGRQVVNEFSGENSGPDDCYYSYIFDDNSTLSFSLGFVYYYTEMEVKYNYNFYFDSYEFYKNDEIFDEMFSTEDIEGIKKNDALDNASKVISLLDIGDILGEPKIYSMDAVSINRLQDEWDVRDKHGEKAIRWTNDQDAYLLLYPVCYQGIPSSNMNATGENEIISSSSVYFVYGRKGMITFNVSGIFDIKNTVQESLVYSPLDVVQNIKNYYENIILDTEIFVNRIKLVYVIRNDLETITEWTVEPVWLVEGKYTDSAYGGKDGREGKDSIVERPYTILISAVSGKLFQMLAIGG
ncbi:MAG: hypothetical protein IJD58_02065 [Lachnospiraceae bacterium]|nr:hypothetical protein [Lachnospiraceae bacterium]